MNLCTLERIKALIKIDADSTEYDAVLNALIEAVSQAAENYMNRNVENTTYTEYLSVYPGEYLFSLKAYPVTSITSIYNDTTWQWASGSSVSTTYVNSDGDSGLLFFDTSSLVAGYNALKVTYVGGMATCTEELLDNYADLAHAAERQVAFLYKTRTKIGAQSVNAVNGGVTWETGVVWLRDVKKVLDMYRRHCSG